MISLVELFLRRNFFEQVSNFNEHMVDGEQAADGDEDNESENQGQNGIKRHFGHDSSSIFKYHPLIPILFSLRIQANKKEVVHLLPRSMLP
jgi:hypothetical protein